VVFRPPGAGVAASSSDQGGRTVHFWNKLSTAALMRLTILASMNLIMGRVVGGWLIMLHPLFFLTVLTIDLGLYALMVYSGTLNKTLIAMMLAGLAGVLAVIGYGGAEAPAFMYGGPFRDVGRYLGNKINEVLAMLPPTAYQRPPLRLAGDRLTLLAYLLVDIVGLAVIVAVGWVARALQAREGRRATPAPPRSS
jgi:hypothetical protein